MTVQFGFNPVQKPTEEKKEKKRATKQATCRECKEKFECRRDQPGKFCSVKCSNVYAGKAREGKKISGKNVDCKQCGNSFYKQTAQLGRGWGKFCSNACKNKWQGENPLPKNFISKPKLGKESPSYKNGKYTGLMSKPKVRKAVIERDGGNWCLFCGKPGPGLHMHRIVYGAQGGKYEVGNVVQLCNEDHELVHSNKRHYQPLLLAYVGQQDGEGWKRWEV